MMKYCDLGQNDNIPLLVAAGKRMIAVSGRDEVIVPPDIHLVGSI